MFRRFAATFAFALMAADACMSGVVLWCAWVLRFGQAAPAVGGAGNVADPVPSVVLFTFAWLVLLWLFGCYGLNRRWTFSQRVRDVLRATVVFAVLVLAVLFLARMSDVSRLYLGDLCPLLALGTLSIRLAGRLLMLVAREFGLGVRYMIVVGANDSAQAFADLVEAHHELNIRVVGHVAGPGEAPEGMSRRVLGDICDLAAIVHGQIVDEVAICLPTTLDSIVAETVELCEQEGRMVRIPAGPVERLFASARLEEIDGVVIHSIVTTPDRLLGLLLKRAIDTLGSALALVVLAPFLAGVAILIKLGSPGPVLVRQERVGVHGRVFEVVKFRTIGRGTLGRGTLGRLRGGRIDQFLQRTSLDGLPQFWNVLRGQMSLVGPRPPLLAEVERYDVWHRRRLAMKPGITGLRQVRDRREPQLERWIRADLEYIDRWSLWLDFQILLRTVPAMVSGPVR